MSRMVTVMLLGVLSVAAPWAMAEEDLLVGQPIEDVLLESWTAKFRLNPAQLELARALFAARCSTWWRENGAERFRLSSEYFRITANSESTTEEAAAYAEQQLLLELDFQAMLRGMAEELRTWLDDEQALWLDEEMAEYEEERRLWTDTLETWRAGGYVRGAGPDAQHRRVMDPASSWPDSEPMSTIGFVEELMDGLRLDRGQISKMRALVEENLSPWLREHQDEFRQQSGGIDPFMSWPPPTAEEVAGYAERRLPLVLERYAVEAGIAEEMRACLDDEQAFIFAEKRAKLAEEHREWTDRLELWRVGGYISDWSPVDSEEKEQQWEKEGQTAQERAERLRKALEDGGDVAAGEGRRATTTQAAAKDPWDVYTEDFIRKYKLDEKQQEKARGVLKRLKAERDRYLRGKSEKLKSLEEALGAGKTAEKRAETQTEFAKVMAPVDKLFGQLKRNLDRLPTREQREAVGKGLRG